MEYDLFHFEHQVPGGMMTNLTRQLREMGMEHRLDEILEEVVRVRREFGYPGDGHALLPDRGRSGGRERGLG